VSDVIACIDKCHVLYAKIDRVRCPGTIAEIGFASASLRIILLNLDALSHDDKLEMWFVVWMSFKPLALLINCMRQANPNMPSRVLYSDLDRQIASASGGRFQSYDVYVEYIRSLPRKYAEAHD
jgi:hypothetical protein